jgi:hypothetical protein
VNVTRIERYRDRVRRRLCVDCAAGLQSVDRLRCVECQASMLASKRRYRTSKKGRAVELSRRRERYANRCSDGRCVDCARPAAEGRVRCDEHLTYHTWRQAVSDELKAQEAR